MIFLNYIIIILVSYLIGSFSTALVFNKVVNKIDPRETGSKNLGALNTLRITSTQKGKCLGLLGFLAVFLVDAFKGAFAVWLARLFIPGVLLAPVLATFFVILGHNYSILLKFQGGRGAATFLGILLFLDYRMFLLWLLIVVLSMFLFEMMIPIDKKRNFFKRAISDQIIGRLFGEAFALIPFCFLNSLIFWVSLPATFLIIIRHNERIKKQLEDYKK